VPLTALFESVEAKQPYRIPGTGILATARPQGTPPISPSNAQQGAARAGRPPDGFDDVPTVDPEEIEVTAPNGHPRGARFGHKQPDAAAPRVPARRAWNGTSRTRPTISRI
jgi:hypothetical protein